MVSLPRDEINGSRPKNKIGYEERVVLRSLALSGGSSTGYVAGRAFPLTPREHLLSRRGRLYGPN